MKGSEFAKQQLDRAESEARQFYIHALGRLAADAQRSLEAVKGSGYIDSFELNVGNLGAEVARAAAKLAAVRQVRQQMVIGLKFVEEDLAKRGVTE
jgi:hypothetical protein